MDKNSLSVHESDFLMIQLDIYAKLSADSFDHFIQLAKELVEVRGTLTPYDDSEHFFMSAVAAGWE